MKPLKCTVIGVVFMLSLLVAAGPARAQGISDSLSKSELVVLEVSKNAGRVTFVDHDFKRRTLRFDKRTVVVNDEGKSGGLELLTVGDIIKIERPAGQPRKIVIVRAASQMSASPEE